MEWNALLVTVFPEKYDVGVFKARNSRNKNQTDIVAPIRLFLTYTYVRNSAGLAHKQINNMPIYLGIAGEPTGGDCLGHQVVLIRHWLEENW